MVEIYRGKVINITSFLFLLSLAFTPDLGYGQEPMSFKGFVAIENNYDMSTDNLSFGFGPPSFVVGKVRHCVAIVPTLRSLGSRHAALCAARLP